MSIRDRVIEFKRVDRDDVLPNEHNWRKHPEPQRAALRGLIQEIGVAGAGLAYYSERNGGKLTLVDGHLRREEIPEQLPVIITDLNDIEADKLLASYDPLAAMAVADKANLDALLREVSTGDAALSQMLTDLAKDNGLTYGAQEPAPAPEPDIDHAAELQKKWKVKTGDVWTIGQHRLMCGDSTKLRDVETLMAGKRAALLATDPPYNVSIDYGENVDDAKVEAEYEAFSRAWFGAWASFSDRQVVTPGCNNLARWCRYFDPYHVAPWTKSNSMTNGKVARWWCWEPVLFFGEHWNRERSNDLFDFPIGQQSGVANHPCPKPLKMWADLITNYSVEGDIIAEAFAGGGTSHVAAEQAGRSCYGMDVEPKWCSVTLERLFRMGMKPMPADRVTQQTYVVHSSAVPNGKTPKTNRSSAG